MAVDTARKRSAANRFGMRWLSGTRAPLSPLDAFERAALLGLYYIAPAPIVFGTPSCGWYFESPDVRLFQFESPDVTVFEFGGCS